MTINNFNMKAISQVNLFVALILFAFSSNAQIIQSTTKEKPVVKTTVKKSGSNIKVSPPKSNLIISVDQACILEVNGKILDTLSSEDVWERKFLYGNLLLEFTLMEDRSIVIKQQVEISKSAKPIIIEFEKLIAQKNQEQQEKKRVQFETEQKQLKAKAENDLKQAITDYKNIYYNASCNSSSLLSKINIVQNLDYSLVEKCSNCHGTGKVDGQEICSYCDGSAQVSCYNCGGKGSVTCSNCKGGGKVFCSCAYNIQKGIFTGNITWNYNAYCNICGGSNGGKGQVNCNVCNGYGKLTCGNCDGKGKTKCNHCENGYVRKKVCCDNCKGLGRIVE